MKTSKLIGFFLSQLGTAYVVGGSVRDSLLGLPPKDLDIEVFGVSMAELESIASRLGPTNSVGASFGILKLSHPELGEIDLSLPRRENKIGVGHKAFNVMPDPSMTIEEAAARRDFTINSMSWSPVEGLVDPFGGQQDLEQRVLRHTSAAFSEDPLRVLRGFQFAGRMGMTVAPETAELCRSLIPEFHAISLDRVWGEWAKWAEKSVVPSKGLEFLRETGWVSLFPELDALQGVPQDPQWHPEGDVWTHTLLVCDAAAAICRREGVTGIDRIVICLAALCHDMAKPSCTAAEVDGRIRSRGHEKAGEEPTRSFLSRIGCPKMLVERIVPLVVNHLAHCAGEPSERMARRLANRLAPATIEELALLVEADHSGRPPLLPGCPEAMQSLLSIARSSGLGEEAPEPILKGRHLVQAGMTPGKEFGVLLKRAFESQLDGLFNDEAGAIEWLAGEIASLCI